MLVNLNQYRGKVEVFNSEFMPSTQSNVFHSTFSCDLDILAISSLIFSSFYFMHVRWHLTPDF